MDFDPQEQWQWDSLAVRAGQTRSGEQEHAETLYLTSSFVYKNAAEAAACFAGEVPGNVYSRYTNPTVRMFEQRMAALDGAEASAATASGMAAILSTCLAHLKAGDHVVASRSIFGSTTNMFNNLLAKFDLSFTFVELSSLEAWRDALKDNTKLLFCETPSNPLAEVVDIQALAELAHAQGALLAIDNTFCTPALQQPLALGADLVISSTTKFIDGQGRALGGVVSGSKALIEPVVGVLRSGGPCMSPFNAWIFIKGLETLSLRMEKHCANAMDLAKWLQQQDAVEKVYYAGLEDSPSHEIASRQQKAFGGVLSFEVKGGREQAWHVMDSTRLLSITANLGDTKTTITHPATTTHGRLSVEERQRAGIKDNLIRVSVGLESLDDIKNDLLRGLSDLT